MLQAVYYEDIAEMNAENLRDQAANFISNVLMSAVFFPVACTPLFFCAGGVVACRLLFYLKNARIG